MSDSMFCGVELGARIEQAAAMMMTAGASAGRARDGHDPVALPLGGGVATWARAGSPLNKIAGLGFAGPPATAELEAIEAAFAARGAPVQVELASLAEAGIAEMLAARGYRLVGFESVLGTRVPSPAAGRRVAGVEVRASGPAELGAWVDTLVEGFAAPDMQGVASHEEFPHEVVEQAMRDLSAASGFVRYLARIGREIAGGGGMFISGGIAQLSGAATLPAFRRRGVQTSLLAARLDDAARAGCDLAVVTTQPGSKSQENVQRQGFHLLYTRAILVRDEGARPPAQLSVARQKE